MNGNFCEFTRKIVKIKKNRKIKLQKRKCGSTHKMVHPQIKSKNLKNSDQ